MKKLKEDIVTLDFFLNMNHVVHSIVTMLMPASKQSCFLAKGKPLQKILNDQSLGLFTVTHNLFSRTWPGRANHPAKRNCRLEPSRSSYPVAVSPQCKYVQAKSIALVKFNHQIAPIWH